MPFEVWLHPKADSFLNSLDPLLKKRIKIKLIELTEEPNKKERQLKPSNFFGMRIGKYRAIYEIIWDKSKVNVLFIGHRDQVYDNFKRLL